MRFRRRTLPLSFRRDPARVRELVRREHLVAARLEAAMVVLGGTGYVDLVFERENEICCAAMIEIEPEMIEQRESSPFIWPEGIAEAIDDDQAIAIEEEILPWIESLALGRTLSEEHVRFYEAAFRDTFETARAAAFLGSAPYAKVFEKAAPYVYAVRFAAGKRVAIDDEFGATGAAMLEKHAGQVSATTSRSSVDELARRWFALDVFGAGGDCADVTIGNLAPADVHIALDFDARSSHRVAVASPVPMDIAISFEPEDAPACAYFSLALRSAHDSRISFPARPRAGGSGGRIALLVRDDADACPNADTDAARYLALRLRGEGFSADVLSARVCNANEYDVVHVLCAAYPEHALDVVLAARSLGKPVVISEPLALRDNEAFWGPATLPHILRGPRDEVGLEDHLELFAARRLEVPGIPRSGEPYTGYRDAQRTLLSLAGALVPATAPAFLPTGDAGDVRHLVGTAPYILLHAPIAPSSNQFVVIRAAAAAGLRLVLAGPIADFEFAARLKHFAGESVAFVAEPEDDRHMLGLYAGARVFADPSWFALGTSRRALAAARGCAIVTSPAVDPADQHAWAAALRSAWNGPRPGVRTAAEDPLTAVITAYAAAPQHAVPA